MSDNCDTCPYALPVAPRKVKPHANTINTSKVAAMSKSATKSTRVPKNNITTSKKGSSSVTTTTIKVITKKVTAGSVQKATSKMGAISAASLKPAVSKAKNAKSPKPAIKQTAAKAVKKPTK